MDGGDDDNQERGSGVGGSRWNPTKEQIGLLERMYSEGVRTPSAEQIQQITSRLKVYGHIEGKNVFYWFQNHKARQRQKQRQERLASSTTTHNNYHQINNPIHRFLGHNINLNINPRPIFPAPSFHPHHYLATPNVICGPYYQLPQSNMGFSPPPPQHNYSAPASEGHIIKRKPASTVNGYYCTATMSATSSGGRYHDDHDNNRMGIMRTLNLFPVHPTGILDNKIIGNNINTNISADNSSANTCTSSSDDTNSIYDNYCDHHNQRFFDFFSSSHATSESD